MWSLFFVFTLFFYALDEVWVEFREYIEEYEFVV